MPTEPPPGDTTGPIVVWFRDDLRIADNPALFTAAATGRPLICVFIAEGQEEGLRPLGGAARWWLHGFLAALGAALNAHGGRLHLFQGSALEHIVRLSIDGRASAVYWNARFDGAQRRIDARS
jgi:deoxyribodipyrimidine photo-lyase